MHTTGSTDINSSSDQIDVQGITWFPLSVLLIICSTTRNASQTSRPFKTTSYSITAAPKTPTAAAAAPIKPLPETNTAPAPELLPEEVDCALATAELAAALAELRALLSAAMALLRAALSVAAWLARIDDAAGQSESVVTEAMNCARMSEGVAAD